jgi:hypothetical protein
MGYGSSDPGGRNEGAGGKPDKDKSDKGGNNKGGSAGSDKGSKDKDHQGSVSPGGTKAEIDKEFGNIGRPGVKSPNASAAQQAMPGVHYNPKYDTYVQRTPIAQENLMDAVDAYNERSWLERALGFIGIGQVDPTTDPNFNAAKQNVPNTSVDVLGNLFGLAGMFTGTPLGSIYDGVKGIYSQTTGTNPTFGEVNIGDFGNTAQPGYGSVPGYGQATGQTDPDESGWGGFLGGGGTGAGGGLFGGGGGLGGGQGGPSNAGGDGHEGGVDGGYWGIPTPPTPQAPPTPALPGTNPSPSEEEAAANSPYTSLSYDAYSAVNIPTYGNWQPVYGPNGQIIGWQNPMQMGIGSA